MGLSFGWTCFKIKPFNSFDYISQKEGSFTESGAGSFDLSVQKNLSILLRNELGLDFSGCFSLGTSKWTLSPKISWVREVRTQGSHYTSEFVGTGVPFTVTGYFPDRSLVSPGVSLAGNFMQDQLSLGLYYNGEFCHGYQGHAYGGEVRFGF